MAELTITTVAACVECEASGRVVRPFRSIPELWRFVEHSCAAPVPSTERSVAPFLERPYSDSWPRLTYTPIKRADGS